METYTKTLDNISRSGDKMPQTYYFQRCTDDENSEYAKRMEGKGLVSCFWRRRDGSVVMSWNSKVECKRVGNFYCRGLELWTHKSATTEVKPRLMGDAYLDSIANFLPEGA